MATPRIQLRSSPPVNPDAREFSQHVRQIVLVGSEPAILGYVQDALVREEITVTRLTSEQAIARLQKGPLPDAVLLQLAGRQALETLTTFREACPRTPIIVFSSFHDSQFIVKAMKMGASDCIHLPFELDSLKESVRRLVDNGVHEENVHEIPLSETASFICACARMNEIRGQCAILARVDLPILVLGESGTGKEIIAQYIHKMSPRAHRTFLKVNCAAMPADLLESELFGYEQGAFTGAVRSKPGKFELCNNGTILLDEIGEMPAQLQPKLLQVLQDGTFSRLGGRSSIQVDVRIISATNIDVYAALASKALREDLYYRLNGFSIHMPPLRDRKEEIPALIRHFVRKLSQKYAQQPPVMSEQLLRAFMEHNWPGNLRELENEVKRFLVLGDEQHVMAELRNARGSVSMAVPQNSPVETTGGGLKKLARSAMGEAETEAMAEALKRNHWNRKQTAAELKISYKALLYKIRQYGLTPSSTTESSSKAK